MFDFFYLDDYDVDRVSDLSDLGGDFRWMSNPERNGTSDEGLEIKDRVEPPTAEPIVLGACPTTSEDAAPTPRMVESGALAPHYLPMEAPLESSTKGCLDTKKKKAKSGPSKINHSSENQPSKTAPSSDTNPSLGPLALHASVYALGSKYMVPGLRASALKKIELALLQTWQMEDLALATHIIFKRTTDHEDPLRTLVVQRLVAKLPRVLDNEAMLNAVESINGLAVAMLRYRPRYGR